MQDKQPNVVDPEIESLMDKVPGLRESTMPEPTPPPAPKEPEAPPKKEEAPTPPEAPKAPEAEKKTEEEKEEEPPAPKSARPEKYIPVKQYTSEKKASNARIKELEDIIAAKGTPEETSQALKDFATEHGLEEKAVADLIEKVAPKDRKPAEKPELPADVQERLAEADQIKAEKMFEQEFTELAVPQLKQLYPSASPEQLTAAKKEIEQIACTKPYLDKSLDFVVFKNQDALGKIFAPDRKGPESSRVTPDKAPAVHSAADFEGDKADFTILNTLPTEKRNEIIEKMSTQAYIRWANWNGQNTDLVINRASRKK